MLWDFVDSDGVWTCRIRPDRDQEWNFTSVPVVLLAEGVYPVAGVYPRAVEIEVVV